MRSTAIVSLGSGHAAPHIMGVVDDGYLILVVTWGYVLFAETPDSATIPGMICVALAGMKGRGIWSGEASPG